MKIAVDLDDTLSVVDRITRAQGYIERMGLPFKLVDEDAHELEEVFNWRLPDVLRFIRAGGITIFTDAEARKGARETMRALRAAGHTVTVLTARTRSWFVNPEKVSSDWLEKRRIPYDNIVAEVADKGTWCAENGYGVLIDDGLENCLSAQAQGVKAILFVGRNNLSRALEVHYGGANWAQVAAVLQRIFAETRA